VKNFQTSEISKDFYHLVEQLEWQSHLRDQALRAASSVVLNVAEGAGLPSKTQKSKHFGIALGSLREVQSALEINRVADTSKAMIVADQVAAHLYKPHHGAPVRNHQRMSSTASLRLSVR
jgi:four helix bundle protein